jgi:hypothetical protein
MPFRMTRSLAREAATVVAQVALIWRQQDIKRINDIRACLLASLPLADRARNLGDLGRDPSLARVLVTDRQMKSLAIAKSVATTDSALSSA